MWYAIAAAFCLFLIFFVGSKTEVGTGVTRTILTTDGLSHFKKGLDLAGWVRLTYKIDFSKYEQAYANNASQLMSVKKTAQDIILQNIDKRISALGVSDYNAYIQKLSDGEYIVVEIGGMQDLDAAKKLIGKTVELEFKVPNDKKEADPETVKARQVIAEDLFGKISKDPKIMKDITANRGWEDINYNDFTDVTFQELPAIYKRNKEKLLSLQTGSMLPTLLTGVYHMVLTPTSSGMDSQVFQGFTMIRYNGKKQITNATPTATDIATYATQNTLTSKNDVVRSTAKAGSIAYDEAKKAVIYVGEEVLSQTAWHDVVIFQVAGSGDLQTVVAALEQGKTAGTSVVASGWKSDTEIKDIVPSFVFDATKKFHTAKEIDASYVVAVRSSKAATETIFPTVSFSVENKEKADALIAGITTKTLYSFEDVLVSDSQQWLVAKDPKTEAVLNGTYFKYASVGQSQTGKPVVSIQFDDKGKDIFCNLTENHIGKQMAIFVGGKLMTAPVIRDKICGGSAQIDGSFDIKGARKLSDDLNSGALPAPLLLSHEETIAPSLGQNALHGALLAGLFGVILVYLFMMFIYGWKKANIALIGLVVFLIYLLGIIKGLGIVSSLSAIAAVILSLGMAVDANVLMYERIREELKIGKKMATAIEDGYERSRAPIKDGNTTTGIIGLLLFLVGVNVFKGFGMMMIINMLLILFVVTPLTRVLLRRFYQSK
jgi:protein-export membrane protein SecD